MTKRAVLMQGNEACVEGALAAGCRFFAGYPITPSSEIAEGMALRLPKVGGTFIQMEDEIASMAAVVGASLAGVKALTATSGPGFSLKQENLCFASFTEVPCVVVNAQRGGPSTGLPTQPSQGDVMQSRWGTHGDHPIIVLSPSSVSEMYRLTIRAFNLAERYRTPVVLLADEVVAHMRENVELLGEEEIEVVDRKRPSPGVEYHPYEAGEDGVPPMADFGDGFRYHVTGLYHDKISGFPTRDPKEVDSLIHRLHNKLTHNYAGIVTVTEESVEDAEILVFAYGSVERSALSAVRQARKEGFKVGLMSPKTLWPFARKHLERVRGRVQAMIVPEMNLGQLVGEVERVMCGSAAVYPVSKTNGELFTPDEIYASIREVV